MKGKFNRRARVRGLESWKTKDQGQIFEIKGQGTTKEVIQCKWRDETYLKRIQI